MPSEKNLEQIHSGVITYCNENFNWDFNPNNPVVRLHEPTFGSDEINAAIDQMLTTNVTMGKQVSIFENQYCKKFGHRYGVMNNSGSSANLLAISAIVNHAFENKLKPGDEVIVPALSWATTVWPIIQNGLIPVIVDCDPSTFNIDINQLKKSITKKTKAIMLVHVYGNPCDMKSIQEITQDHNLLLIEDCCESMGAFYKKKAIGTFGLMGTFSFYFSHHITTFEGGITLTDNFELSEILRVMRAHGWSREAIEKEKYIEMYKDIDPRFIFINLGYNLRPTEVQAVIGQKQLPKLDNIVKNRRCAYKRYRNNLQNYEQFFNFQEEQEDAESSWFGFALILKPSCKFSVKDFAQYLNDNSIETRPVIAGNIANHPVMKNYNHRISGNLINSNEIMKNGLAVACHHAMTNDAVDYVCGCISEFIKRTS